jgi:hypothetical protein
MAVLATVSLLVTFSIPAVRALVNSFETSGGAEMMISSALATGRAIAAKEQRYAGVRFQCRYDATKSNKLGCQYMIFIVHDMEATGLANGFRAVEGTQPIKLPENVGVMEVVIRDSDIDAADKVKDKTTFSVIFSPSGKLLIHDVQVRNRDGDNNPVNPDDSADDIFNSPDNISNYETGMFIQDDYETDYGCKKESSRSRFRIYDREVFESTDVSRRYTDYLKDMKVIHVNPYTGRMIE